ncbi:MAG TPA: helix-turn-helix domain-containing protein, partial [Kribbella sp.]|nr:helix-turn-helix domain-containing protein [Kribbella sp.]
MAGEASTGTFLQGLERGLAVIRAFSAAAPSLTLSEVARAVGITPATARRILLTLEDLGYVRSDSRRFSLTPRVLALGWAYLSSLNLWDVAEPFMAELSGEVQETCSACTLDLPDIVFVARVPSKRILMMSLAVGSRLPA